jgi:hypothetical protein
MQTKEERKKKRKQYRKDNAEKINAYQKQYYLDNATEIKKRSIKQKKKYRQENVEKIKKYQKEYDKNNSKRKKYSHIKRDFGITENEYDLIFAKQEGKCAICGKHQNEFKTPLGIDHDHETGKVRGLLCFNCNTGIGKLKDDITILEKAIEYLKTNM